MKISPITLGFYATNNSSKKTSFGCEHCAQTMGIEDKLPRPEKYAECSSWMIPYEKRDALKNEYKSKILEAVTTPDGKLDKRIVDFLDNQKFEIEDVKTGQKSLKTIKEAIDSAIVRTYDVDTSAYHATWTREVGEQIIKNGFDPSKISRTKLGPGFYFSAAEGGAFEYSSCILMADFKGNCAQVTGPFYEKIMDSYPGHALANFIGLKSKDYDLGMAESEVCTKLINEYARDYLVNDIGVDMAYGPSGRFETCYAVYNPDVISNTRFRN